MANFINDEEELEEEESSYGSHERRKEKKKKKERKPSKRKPRALDDEDRELVRENVGIDIGSKRKRLHRLKDADRASVVDDPPPVRREPAPKQEPPARPRPAMDYRAHSRDYLEDMRIEN